MRTKFLNNPAIFNAYYERAEQCYARAYELSSNKVYQRELHKIYLAWSDKLWWAEDWSQVATLLQKGVALDYERRAFYPRLLHTLLLQGKYAEAEERYAAWMAALSVEEKGAFKETFLEDYEGLKEWEVVLEEQQQVAYAKWLERIEAL